QREALSDHLRNGNPDSPLDRLVPLIRRPEPYCALRWHKAKRTATIVGSICCGSCSDLRGPNDGRTAKSYVCRAILLLDCRSPDSVRDHLPHRQTCAGAHHDCAVTHCAQQTTCGLPRAHYRGLGNTGTVDERVRWCPSACKPGSGYRDRDRRWWLNP